jgi:hypothetical protein
MSPSPALKTDTVYLSETLASTGETTRRQNPEEQHHIYISGSFNDGVSNSDYTVSIDRLINE